MRSIVLAILFVTSLASVFATPVPGGSHPPAPGGGHPPALGDASSGAHQNKDLHDQTHQNGPNVLDAQRTQKMVSVSSDRSIGFELTIVAYPRTARHCATLGPGPWPSHTGFDSRGKYWSDEGSRAFRPISKSAVRWQGKVT